MKIFITLMMLVIFVGAGFFIYSKVKTLGSGTITDINTTLTGTISKVEGNSEYSYQLKNGTLITGINSSHVDLSPFVDKKVSVTGQYSGTVLYVDKVTEIN